MVTSLKKKDHPFWELNGWVFIMKLMEMIIIASPYCVIFSCPQIIQITKSSQMKKPQLPCCKTHMLVLISEYRDFHSWNDRNWRWNTSPHIAYLKYFRLGFCTLNDVKRDATITGHLHCPIWLFELFFLQFPRSPKWCFFLALFCQNVEKHTCV